jgi:hypothetical protein
MKIAATSSIDPPYRLPVFLGCMLLALLTNFLLGKDMPSDTLSYHLYAGFSAVHDRFTQDYFPAGPQSYFNPFAYVPLYYLARSNLSSLEISSMLALVHSVMLWLTYELAVIVCPRDDKRERLMFGLCGVAFALINPILLQQIGSTFADITTAELVLAGWLLLALAVRAPSTARVVGAGLLCGLATGFKLTNALHAMAGFALLIMLPLTLQGRLRQGFAYGISLALGFVAVAAPWAYRLEERFGNPLFPMMNNLFRSPEYTTELSAAFRFIPESFAQALSRPFAMIDPVTMVHEELRAPDPRYALLLLLFGALLYLWLRRHGPWQRRAASSIQSGINSDSGATRVLAALCVGFAADWVLWLNTFGNSRYFLPMSSVAAVVIVGLLFRLLATRPKTRNYIIVSILGLQCIQLWMGTDFRWNEAPWDEHWINIAVPARLKSESNLYLTIGAQTNSFVAPYLAPGSGLINFSGLYTLGPDGASGAHIESLMNRYGPNIRILIRGERLYKDSERHLPNSAQIDDALSAFSLRVDGDDCLTIAVHGLTPDLEFTMASSQPAVRQSRDTTYLLSCHVLPDNADHSPQIAMRRNVDLALDHLEDSCPALFQPRRPRTEKIGDGGLRRYAGTDLVAWVGHGSVKFLQPSIGGDVVSVGSESDWVKGAIPIRCGRNNGRYFASSPTLQ